MQLTIFPSVFDNKTHRKMNVESWAGLVKLLRQLSTLDGYKPKKGEHKQGSPLISPAIFKEGTTRANANVTHWAGWAALDIDEWTEEGLVKLENKLRSYTHVKYSTSSSTKEKPKFRLILRLDRYVEASEIRHMWYALNKEFAELGDPQTKDLARMFYVPAQYPGAYNFFDERLSNDLCVSELLKKHHFEDNSAKTIMGRLPEAMQKKILEYRNANLTNKNIRWSSYRDCPFVNQELVREYATCQSNWYRKMYQIMVSISSKAIKRGYPITPQEVTALCKQIDSATGNWYQNRPFGVEAARAIEFSLR